MACGLKYSGPTVSFTVSTMALFGTLNSSVNSCSRFLPKRTDFDTRASIVCT